MSEQRTSVKLPIESGNIIVQIPTDKALLFELIYITIYYGINKSVNGINVLSDFMMLLNEFNLEQYLRTAIYRNRTGISFDEAIINHHNHDFGKLLLQLGAKIENGYAALSIAFARNDVDLANMCIKYFPSLIHVECTSRKSLLHYAISRGIKWVQWCIDAGATVGPDELIEATKQFVKTSDDKTIRLLLKYNASKKGLNAAFIHLANESSPFNVKTDTFYDITKLFLQCGADQYAGETLLLQNGRGGVWMKTACFIEMLPTEEMYDFNDNEPPIFTPEVYNDISRIKRLVTIYPVYQQLQTVTVVFTGILPVYVILWITDWLIKDELTQFQKIKIIEKMKQSIETVKADRINLLKN